MPHRIPNSHFQHHEAGTDIIIVEYGYDQIFGARPLKRAIQNIVEKL